MIPRQPWFERQFSFDLPVSAAPGVLERLRGTPPRLEHRLAGVAPVRLTARVADRWSIQENVGHLGDLEPLWMARVDDLAMGRPALHPADLDNRATHEAHHNARPLRELLDRFARARADLVTQLESADQADWLRSALHPRLKQPMRLLDLAFFIAEHDDHHLATITELRRLVE
jgi:uncharacterized damage-inducible protein DinB